MTDVPSYREILQHSDLTDDSVREVFRYQYSYNSVYRRFCEAMGIKEPATTTLSLKDIPLIPIEAFKDAEMLSLPEASDLMKPDSGYLQFKSSGTSGMNRSCHLVPDPEVYRTALLKGMDAFYEREEFVILAYTPGYNDNPDSSLIWMLNELATADKTGLSRFLELKRPVPAELLQEIKQSGRRVMLFGAAFGLLDLIDAGNTELPENSIIMETGGMKTHRREMSKDELHIKLSEGFGLPQEAIHSEYGMTELLSQAYSTGNGRFRAVPWMKISIRNPENPLEVMAEGEDGLIGVMDMANIYSCSFILTGDRGVMHKDGSFEVKGRWNPRNMRGCNFLIDRD